MNIVDLARDLLREWTLHPDTLEVWLEPGKIADKLCIRGHQTDTGRILGKRAGHLAALKTVLTEAYHHEERKLLVVELLEAKEQVDQEREGHRVFVPDPNWPRQRILDLIERMLRHLFNPFVMEREDSSCTTVMLVGVSSQESFARVSKLETALKVLINLIGKPNGRLLLIRIEQGLEPEAAQPKTAAGRFTKEIER